MMLSSTSQRFTITILLSTVLAVSPTTQVYEVAKADAQPNKPALRRVLRAAAFKLVNSSIVNQTSLDLSSTHSTSKTSPSTSFTSATPPTTRSPTTPTMTHRPPSTTHETMTTTPLDSDSECNSGLSPGERALNGTITCNSGFVDFHEGKTCPLTDRRYCLSIYWVGSDMVQYAASWIYQQTIRDSRVAPEPNAMALIMQCRQMKIICGGGHLHQKSRVDGSFTETAAYVCCCHMDMCNTPERVDISRKCFDSHFCTIGTSTTPTANLPQTTEAILTDRNTSNLIWIWFGVSAGVTLVVILVIATAAVAYYIFRRKKARKDCLSTEESTVASAVNVCREGVCL